MALPVVPLALGGLALYLLTRKPLPPFSTVQAASGRTWLVRTIHVQGTGPSKVSTTEVWAPAGSFGPHGSVLVATYTQKADDKNSRVAVMTGPHAVPAMITAAGQDFGIKKPA